ncbi:MAG: hypothetical protein OXI46_07815 [Gemmatimonadota bacterium]|nr:hypothetical protein [Gemmatimonadota bacterium]
MNLPDAATQAPEPSSLGPGTPNFSGMVVRGVVAGLVGATAMALWFLIVDSSEGQPFRTPNFVAASLLGVQGMEMGVGLIILYTLLHYLVWILVGLVSAWVLDQVEIASPILIGLVLGFLLFDLVFYGSVVVTGANIIQALGWPEVLAGNLLAGMSLMAILHWSGPTRKMTWWEALGTNKVVREGIVCGTIGAAVVAIWFLVFDVLRGEPFFTPAALGSALFLGASNVEAVSVEAATVIGYSLLHLLAFTITGFLVAVIVTAADDTPPLIVGAVMFFAVFEALFMGLLAMVAEFLLGSLAWWTIAAGNVMAAVAMGWYLWEQHPKLRAALAMDPLDRTG